MFNEAHRLCEALRAKFEARPGHPEGWRTRVTSVCPEPPGSVFVHIVMAKGLFEHTTWMRVWANDELIQLGPLPSKSALEWAKEN